VKVSVVIPVFNAEPFLRQALISVLSQNHADLEVVLIDDGSTDRSAEVATAMDDPRIRLVRQPNRGIVEALNRGLDEASGELIARMDGDDEMMPGRLAAQVDFLRRNGRILACGTDYDLFGTASGRVRTPHRPTHCRARLLFGSPMAHPAVMIRRSALDGNGLRYRAAFGGAEDFRLFSELAEFGELANLPMIGLRYRRHAGQLSSVARSAQRGVHLRICLDNLRSVGITDVSAPMLQSWLWPQELPDTSSADYLRTVGGLVRTARRGAGTAGVATALQLVRENLAALRRRGVAT